MKKLKVRKPNFTEQEVLKFLLAWGGSLETYQVIQRQDGTKRLKFTNGRGEEIMMFIDQPGIEEAAVRYLISHGTIPQVEEK